MSNKSQKHIVSLGVGCGVAFHLEKLKLRQQAYPLDYIWIKNLPNLRHILQDDFNILLDQKYFVKVNKSDPKRIHHSFYDDISQEFHATFAHHDILDSEMYNTFHNRVERFRSLKTESSLFITFAMLVPVKMLSNLTINPNQEDATLEGQCKIFKDIVRIMRSQGYLKSRFMLILLKQSNTLGAESEMKLYDETNQYHIYIFTYVNDYIWGPFSGTDNEVMTQHLIQTTNDFLTKRY